MREPVSEEPAMLSNSGSGLLQALARLNEIGASINHISGHEAADLPGVLALIVESAVKTLPGSVAVIYTYDPRRQTFDLLSRVSAGEGGWAGEPDAAMPPDDAPRPNGLGMHAVRRKHLILSSQLADISVHPAKAAMGARAAAALPLIVADQPEGVLYVYLREYRPFTELELLLLGNLVNQAAIAAYHARQVAQIQRDLARKQDELVLLHDAALLISSRTRLGETLEAILQMSLEVTGARYGIFRLADRSGENLVTAAIAGEHLGRPAVEALPTNATSVMGWVSKTRRPLNIPDVTQPPWSRIYYPLDHALDMRSELAVPLIGAGGRLEGVLNLESPHPGAFSEADSHLLQSLASQAVIAIQEVRLLDALQDTTERLLNLPAGEVLGRLATLACELLNVDGSGVWALEREELVLRAAGAADARNIRPPLPDDMIRRAIETASPVAYQRGPDEAAGRSAGWSHVLVAPVLVAADRQPVGALAVYASDQRADAPPTEWDKKVLGILAHYAALALENETRQRALREAQEARAVAETFAALGDVAANLLHHLNNKVGAIPVRIEGIQDKCAPALAANPYLAANLAEIERAALDAMAAVRERLSLLQPAAASATSIADSVADALAQTQLPDRMVVALTGLDTLPPVVAGSEGLTLTLVNLLENAREAMAGCGRVTIRGEAEAGWVEIAVSDDGPGIPLDQQAHIFDFSFSEGRRAENGRGGASPSRLGFGLWWVRTLMARLGGSIIVESDGATGSTFRLRLPIAQGNRR